ncbi:MAG: DUF541 domain-containing protein [Firmicutes bacterium]|nr:DUF541 domain-containing protein [Bacillota bacterium]
MYKIKTLSITLVIIFLLGIGFLAGNFNSNEVVIADDKEVNTINVNGEATVKIKPDMAYLNVGIETENKDSKLAQNENKEKMEKIIKALKNEEINEDSIKTIKYNIHTLRKYNKEDGSNEITGYRVINEVQITIDKIEKIGTIIDKVSDKGANHIRNIRFGTNKREEYYIKALKKAVKNAEKKAKALAETVDVKIGDPYKINESSSVSYSVDRYYNSSELKSNITPIESGELEIKAKVNVIYNY